MRSNIRRGVFKALMVLAFLMLLAAALPMNSVAPRPQPPKVVIWNGIYTLDVPGLIGEYVIINGGHTIGKVTGIEDSNGDGKLSPCDNITIHWQHPESIKCNEELSRVKMIILELLGSINLDAGDLAQNLCRIYISLFRNLNKFFVTQDTETITKSRKILENLEGAWEEVFNSNEYRKTVSSAKAIGK